MVPIVHHNGTSRAALVDQVCEAGMAITLALGKLASAAPNGRDYYPLGPEAFERASAEHRSRVERLVAVRTELEALAEAIADARNHA